MMLPRTPLTSTSAKLISPLAAQYPAGGITSSLGTGRIDDSMAISATIPGYPTASSVCSSQSMKRSSIEAVLPHERHESRFANWSRADAGGRAPNERQRLRALGAKWNDHGAVRCQLLDQWWWDLRPARGD